MQRWSGRQVPLWPDKGPIHHPDLTPTHPDSKGLPGEQASESLTFREGGGVCPKCSLGRLNIIPPHPHSPPRSDPRWPGVRSGPGCALRSRARGARLQARTPSPLAALSGQALSRHRIKVKPQKAPLLWQRSRLKATKLGAPPSLLTPPTPPALRGATLAARCALRSDGLITVKTKR